MKFDNMLPFRMGVLGLSLMIGLAMASTSDDLSQEYCSNDNTGSDYTPSYSIYMSMGKCFDICKEEYAFAVVQYKHCWCSNYAPYSQQSTGDCDQACPGYPNDQCGNQPEGAYGYIPLYRPPSGTKGAPSSTQQPSSAPPQSTNPPESSQPPDTSQPLDTSQPPGTSQTSETSQPPESTKPPQSTKPPPPPQSSSKQPKPTPSSVPYFPSSSAPSSSSSSSSTSTTHSPKISPATTVRITTVSGTIITQTITQSANPAVVVTGTRAPDAMQMQRKGLSGGAIAGIVIGSLVGAAALALAAFLLWRRRKSSDAEGGVATTRRPKRTGSVLSRTGLLGRGRPQSMSENLYDDAYTNVGDSSVRHSMMFGAGAAVEGVSPVSPLGGSQDEITNPRHSRPLVYDQRLNPSALFANPEANGSRASMQDQQDYSRPLGLANPDWRSSFDSR